MGVEAGWPHDCFRGIDSPTKCEFSAPALKPSLRFCLADPARYRALFERRIEVTVVLHALAISAHLRPVLRAVTVFVAKPGVINAGDLFPFSWAAYVERELGVLRACFGREAVGMSPRRLALVAAPLEGVFAAPASRIAPRHQLEPLLSPFLAAVIIWAQTWAKLLQCGAFFECARVFVARLAFQRIAVFDLVLTHVLVLLLTARTRRLGLARLAADVPQLVRRLGYFATADTHFGRRVGARVLFNQCLADGMVPTVLLSQSRAAETYQEGHAGC